MRTTKDNLGVTLIELMIALVISAILVGGTYSIFITQQRTYVLQDQVVGVQQDARTALTIIARDIRMAGMLTGDEFSVNGATEAITPTNSSTAPDQIRVVYAAEEVSVASSVDSEAKQVTLTSGADRFDTSTRKYVAFEGIGHVYQVSSRDIGTNTITLTESPPDYLADFSARVYCVNAITYDVSGNTLRRNDGSGAQNLAGVGDQSDVEDLQIAYQVEDDTSHWYNDPSDAGADNSDIRAVRISLLVRTVLEDTNEQSYQRPALEDRAGSGTQDGFRRRVYTTVVKLRNR